MTMLLVLLLVLLAQPVRCQEEDGGYNFDRDIRQFAVATDTVYVATDERLYQLSHDLTLIQTLTLRGILGSAGRQENALFKRVSESDKRNATLSVHVLLPFVNNDTLINCGVLDSECGYCELLELRNISNMLYQELILVGPPRRSNASVAVLVNVTSDSVASSPETYILTAVQKNTTEKDGKCPSSSDVVNLHNTNNNQKGLIFSVRGESVNPDIGFIYDVEFVDGFQVGASIYLFCNLPNKTNEVRLLWLKGEMGKVATLKTVQGGTLDVPDAGNSIKLLASSLVPGETPVLWVGVFTAEKGGAKTQLVLFDISTDLDKRTQKDPNFCSGCGYKRVDKLEKTLSPEAVIFRHDHMTAVLAVRQKAWMVFFIGTQDGQLIKLAVDKRYKSSCPVVLYRADDDRLVFPKLHLDQVERRHIYVPVRNQIKRVPVARCSKNATVRDCWSAQDPHCVWCSSKKSCTFEDDCQNSDWLSIPDEFQQRMVSHEVAEKSTDQVTLMMQMHANVGQNPVSNFTCEFSANSTRLCSEEDTSPNLLQCSCSFPKSTLPTDGLQVQVGITLGGTRLSEQKKIYNCANLNGTPTSALCQRCLDAGCGWKGTGCSWANEGSTNVSVCQQMSPERDFSAPTISSISPDIVSFYGKNQVVLKGRNLGDVTGVRIQASVDCKPQESPVSSNTGETLIFNIPGSSRKGTVKVCVLLPDGTCHGDGNITYQSLPFCSDIKPDSSWSSGKRKMTLTGSRLEFVEGVIHSPTPESQLHTPSVRLFQNLTYDSPAMTYGQIFFVSFKVANKTVPCNKFITYYPNPKFSNFTTARTGDAVRITIQKKADNLKMSPEELLVWGVQRGKAHKCLIKEKKNTDETEFFICDIMNASEVRFQSLKIMYGNETVILTPESIASTSLLMLLVLLLIPCIIILVVIVYRRKQKKLADQMNKRMEELELDIRNDIRQGFVDLQTEKADLLETAGAIPFLDYKHFAAKIFFPESKSLMASCIKDIGQDVVQVQLDAGCQGMSKLIHDQLFLTSMVHALEERKNFSIKEKCMFASLLTVALHGNLPYLTEVMEILLRDLMQQSSSSGAQPKLLLRRTESIVEKLLTNWMSICLYGFLRETAGQHLFLMVSALTQQTAKGPVDCVTEKALYTLSEDWLLWQAPDFSSLKLNVLFAVGCDGEVSEPLEVNALSCDTVEQVKGKILTSFRAKFGFPYCTPLGELRVEYQKNGSFVPLEEVDASSEVIGEVTMLNTLKHYQVPDGATIKVLSRNTHPPLSPQGSLKDDENFSGKYFHLIDPEDVEDQRKNPERKKLKLKEVHLTKLLSTKVAVHTFVENLFRSIWGTPHSKAPLAVKYFFDFLDAQADSMKITDPDMLHIWKTNSLPLRYWVNIIKNPQFVFDMEKTANLDGCLSVIGQAFMDSFSLTDTQLGKYAPTNKLLYAKDIPKFKQEVKVYYKQVREQSPVTASEFKSFLLEESKKHENEFNETVALRELYKFIERYLAEIKEKLDQNGAPAELKEQLLHVKNLFDGLKSCSWN